MCREVGGCLLHLEELEGIIIPTIAIIVIIITAITTVVILSSHKSLPPSC